MDPFRSLRLLCLTAAMLLISSAARAADTGSISGIVVDQAGAPLVDVAVKVSSSVLPAGRTIRTSINGSYLFEYLVPGDYLVEVDTTGRPVLRRPVAVELGRETQADFVVGVAVTESVTVTAATPTVDVRSSEASF